jgi:hypothetical protein
MEKPNDKTQTHPSPKTSTESLPVDESELQRQAVIQALDTLTKLGLAVVDINKSNEKNQCCTIC